MTQNKRVAVTGGIGSGKSELLRILSDMGYPVCSCDEVSRALWHEKEYLNLLAQFFPDCTTDGGVDKKKLSQKVFSDSAAREKLNAVSHPLILERLFRSMKGELCFAEVPLLFECGLEGCFDAVIAVRRNKDCRIAALKARDGWTEKEIQGRMNAQFDPARLGEKNCFILENDGTREELLFKVREILKKL